MVTFERLAIEFFVPLLPTTSVARTCCADPKAIAAVEHMLEQEKQHLATFNALIPERRARPTALMPLWNIAGAAAGGISALFGTKTAMALTIAVEVRAVLEPSPVLLSSRVVPRCSYSSLLRFFSARRARSLGGRT